MKLPRDMINFACLTFEIGFNRLAEILRYRDKLRARLCADTDTLPHSTMLSVTEAGSSILDDTACQLAGSSNRFRISLAMGWHSDENYPSSGHFPQFGLGARHNQTLRMKGYTKAPLPLWAECILQPLATKRSDARQSCHSEIISEQIELGERMVVSLNQEEG